MKFSGVFISFSSCSPSAFARGGLAVIAWIVRRLEFSPIDPDAHDAARLSEGVNKMAQSLQSRGNRQDPKTTFATPTHTHRYRHVTRSGRVRLRDLSDVGWFNRFWLQKILLTLNVFGHATIVVVVCVFCVIFNANIMQNSLSFCGVSDYYYRN